MGEELAEQHHEVGQRHEPEGDRVSSREMVAVYARLASMSAADPR